MSPPQFCHPTQNILPWPPQISFGTPPLKLFVPLTPTRFFATPPIQKCFATQPPKYFATASSHKFCHPTQKYFTMLPPKNICHYTTNKICHRTPPNIFATPIQPQFFLPLHPQNFFGETRSPVAIKMD